MAFSFLCNIVCLWLLYFMGCKYDFCSVFWVYYILLTLSESFFLVFMYKKYTCTWSYGFIPEFKTLQNVKKSLKYNAIDILSIILALWNVCWWFVKIFVKNCITIFFYWHFHCRKNGWLKQWIAGKAGQIRYKLFVRRSKNIF